jgi:transcriptional regulator with XRE-family HTH domain
MRGIYKTKSDNNIYKQLRIKANLTQKQVAEILRLSFSAISSWELGRSIPNPELLPKIAKLYNTTIDYLITGKESPENKKEAQKEITDATGFYRLASQLTDSQRNLVTQYMQGILDASKIQK